MAKKPAPKGNPNEAFLKSGAKFKKNWKESRKVDPGESFGQPDLPDGSFNCRLTGAKCGADKNGVPYVSFQFIIADGPHKGKRPSIYHGIRNDDSLDYIAKDLQRMGIETKEMEFEDIPAIIAELAEEQPFIRISVRNKEYEKVVNGKKVKTPTLNVYADQLLEDYDPADADEDEEETEEEEVEEEEEEEEETDEDESEEEEEEEKEEEEDEYPDPTKGDAVLYKAPKTRKATEFTVIKVLASKRICDLKNENGKVFKNVSFDDVEVVFEEEEN